jgi:hypothetical protein
MTEEGPNGQKNSEVCKSIQESLVTRCCMEEQEESFCSH